MNPIVKVLLFPAVIIRRLHDNYLKKNNPEKLFSIFHKRVTGKSLNLDNPQTMNEKIAYMAFRTDTSEWSRLADKVRVREYIEECGYGDCLPKLYGVWEKAEDIDFATLPESFVIKTNNASATNILVRNKKAINEEEIRKQLDRWLKIDYGYETCQPHYSRIKPMILAEEFLINDQTPEASLIDYKFYCINGEPQVIQIVKDRKPNSHFYRQAIVDASWKCCSEYCSGIHNLIDTPERPQSFEKMMEMSRVFSKPFPFVRVDFYEVNQNPVFGEMTFTPGFDVFSQSSQEIIGEKIMLQ